MVSAEYLQALKSQKFGIEIEFSFITREMAKNVICETLFNDDMIDNRGRKWKIVRDGSVVPRKRDASGSEVSADDSYRVELNSPILTYEDMDLLLKVVDALRRTGAQPSRLCGLHIHVDEEGHTVNSLRNILNLFMQKESIMTEAFQISPDRQSKYCKNVCERLITEINKHRAHTLPQLRKQWENTGGGRYRMLNLDSFYSNKGIEFRLFNSSLNTNTVRAYIIFCLAISQKAKTMQRAVPIKSGMENNRYEWRNFLNRLGLAGVEFKSVRKELLKHVSGDSAFHVPEEHRRRRINSP